MSIDAQKQEATSNYQLYEMTKKGDSPVTLALMRDYLGICNTTRQDTLIQDLINQCTAWGQLYTGREFSANTYTLLIDCFEDRILVKRNPTDSITSVEYSVTTSFDTAVASSVFYLKNGTQRSEILLFSDQSWPTDELDIEQGIKITFVTKAVGIDKIDLVISAIKRHVAFMFENRGDCGDCGDCSDAAGVKPLYNLLRIARI